MKMKEFVDNLNRDQARGNLAPHQIILLISLNKLYSESKSNTLEILDLIDVFDSIWKEHQNTFKTKNRNLGMPLRVFVNRDYVKIEINEDIKDFRNKIEIKTKIKKIILSQLLINLMKNKKFIEYLKTRIKS